MFWESTSGFVQVRPSLKKGARLSNASFLKPLQAGIENKERFQEIQEAPNLITSQAPNPFLNCTPHLILEFWPFHFTGVSCVCVASKYGRPMQQF